MTGSWRTGRRSSSGSLHPDRAPVPLKCRSGTLAIASKRRSVNGESRAQDLPFRDTCEIRGSAQNARSVAGATASLASLRVNPRRPIPEDRIEAIRIALSGIANGVELGEIASDLEPLHPKNNTFPGEVLLELAADAIDESGATRQVPLDSENIRKRHLPEDRAHTKAQQYKVEFALHAAAMIRGGVDPALLDEAAWWREDDLWFWALEALLVYVRAAGERISEPVRVICERVASRHDVELDAGSS